MKQRIKLRIAQWLFKHLYKLVLEDEILRSDPKTGDLYLRGKKLDKKQVISLQEEARMIQSSSFWQLLVLEMVYLANKKMFNEALSTNDLLGGKFMLYTIDIMSKKVYNISTK